MCDIHWSQQTLDLHSKHSASAADNGAVSVQIHTGVTISMAMNAYADVLPLLDADLFSFQAHLFISPLQPLV